MAWENEKPICIYCLGLSNISRYKMLTFTFDSVPLRLNYLKIETNFRISNKVAVAY